MDVDTTRSQISTQQAKRGYDHATLKTRFLTLPVCVCLCVPLSLAATALCHLSYFDLGVPLQNRLSPFTPYSYALVLLHAEKASNFMLLTPTKVGMATKGILRRAPQEGSPDDKQKQRVTMGQPQMVRSAVTSSLSASSNDHMSLTAPLSLDSTLFHGAPVSPTAGVRKVGSHRMTSSSAVGAGQSTAPVSRAGSTKDLHTIASSASAAVASSSMDASPSESSSNSHSSAPVTTATTAAKDVPAAQAATAATVAPVS